MKKLKKDIGGLIGANVGVGIGSSITASLPSTGVAGFSPSAGMATLSGFMPVVNTAVMGSNALRLTRKMYPTRRIRRRR